MVNTSFPKLSSDKNFIGDGTGLIRNGAIKPIRLTTEILHQNFFNKGEFSSFTNLNVSGLLIRLPVKYFPTEVRTVKSNLVLNR